MSEDLQKIKANRALKDKDELIFTAFTIRLSYAQYDKIGRKQFAGKARSIILARLESFNPVKQIKRRKIAGSRPASICLSGKQYSLLCSYALKFNTTPQALTQFILIHYLGDFK